MKTESAQHGRLTGRALAVLSVAAGSAIANNYAMQPALSAIAADFGVGLGPMTGVISGAIIGYLIGLVLLVPLVDRVSPRALIPGQILVLACSLVLAAWAASPQALIGCFVLIGAATTVAAQSSAMVGKFADARHRALSMATISAGISAGILLSRFVGGLLAQWCGWRGALLVLAAFTAVCGLCVLPLLPTQRPSGQAGYFSTLCALPSLVRQSTELRLRICAGMLWFFAFNLVWVGLAVRLAAPPYHLDAASIGLYSLAGVIGLAMTRIAGRLADRFGNRRVIVCGLVCASLAAAALALVLDHAPATLVALALFDAGCFTAQVANQAGVVAIDPARAGVLNSAYLFFYYGAGAMGTALAGTIAMGSGWAAISLLAAAAAAVAGIVSAFVVTPAMNRPESAMSSS